jgi:hypothetical protein
MPRSFITTNEMQSVSDHSLSGRAEKKSVREQIELSSALDYSGLALLRDAWERFGFGEAFADTAGANAS